MHQWYAPPYPHLRHDHKHKITKNLRSFYACAYCSSLQGRMFVRMIVFMLEVTTRLLLEQEIFQMLIFMQNIAIIFSYN